MAGPDIEEVLQKEETSAAAPTKATKADPDPRPHLNIVFIGHVDAGKSTTCGNILYLTGGVDSRTIEKYEREAKEKNRESWFLAFVMDTNEEERQKVRLSACKMTRTFSLTSWRQKMAQSCFCFSASNRLRRFYQKQCGSLCPCVAFYSSALRGKRWRSAVRVSARLTDGLLFWTRRVTKPLSPI